jgi:lipoprotein signal peptidase
MPLTDRKRPFETLLRIAFLVAIGDYVTKEAAARFLAVDPVSVGTRIHFAVVHNSRAAFGFSLGQYTWQLNLALTLAAIALVIPVSRDLARIDRSAPKALGLIMGGALGNLTSLVLSPRGVVDFIALDVWGNSEIVLNVADVAAYVGLAMVLRTGLLIVNALRTQALGVVLPAPGKNLPPVASLMLAEREIKRPVHLEPLLHSLDRDMCVDGLIEDVRPDTRVLPFPVLDVTRNDLHLPSVDSARADGSDTGESLRDSIVPYDWQPPQ